jgi:NadR type nicotinamide-nucleotide adenylyltransferase
VTVHVCSIAAEPIPGALRFRWMQEHFGGCPGVTLVHNDDPNPQAPEECPDHFWDIWHDSLLRRIDRPPDLVFASEPYGFRLAETLGARYVPVDHARENVPVSGTQLRADPLRYWPYLLPPARPYFARRIAVVGPESSGKSTLTAHLATHFSGVGAAEYGRTYLDAVPSQWVNRADGTSGFNEEALLTILRGHRASVEALALQSATGVLFSDTEAIVTACWSRALLGYVPAEVMTCIREQRYDLYLVASATETWADDGTRVHADYDVRKQFEEACLELLRSHGYRFVVLRGTWAERTRQAESAVEALLAPP